MTDRELLQMALDALKHLCLHSAAIKGYDGEQVQTSIDALRARLAQPENDFNPDWDAMAVMVEEQQRMAKRIEELEARLSQPEPAECDGGQCGIGGYCKQCPKTKSDVPETAFGEIKPVLYQVRGRPNWDTEPKWGEWKFCTEPVANDYKKTPVLHDWEYQVRSLYTAPSQREWQGLTDEEMWDVCKNLKTVNLYPAIEAKLKEKNSG